MLNLFQIGNISQGAIEMDNFLNGEETVKSIGLWTIRNAVGTKVLDRTATLVCLSRQNGENRWFASSICAQKTVTLLSFIENLIKIALPVPCTHGPSITYLSSINLKGDILQNMFVSIMCFR